MKRSLLVLPLALFLSFQAFSQSPGGVSTNLRWWMKANAGAFTNAGGTTAATDGTLVQRWNDQSGIGNNATQATSGNRPTFKTNIINSNPVLRFATDQFIDATSTPGVGATDNLQMFLVFQQNSYSAGGTTDGSGSFIIDRPTATSSLMSFKIVNTDKYFYQKRNDSGGSLTGPVSVTSAIQGPFVIAEFYRNVGVNYGIYLNGKLDATSGGDSEAITAPTIRVGRHATNTNAGLDGDLAEVILYNRMPSAAERNKIESYLAIKYGITLDQSTSTDYVSSTGTVVYPATTTHDNYDNNIAGIGRDNGSALNQTNSKSQNTQGIVNIFNPSSLDDGDFLVWGNDAPTIWNSPDVPAPYVNRLSRIWRAAETGDVGTFSISFDLSSLNVDMSDPTKFALLIDNNGVFDDATAYTTGRTISGNVVTFTGADINNNQYFSLASPLVPGPGGVAGTTVWLRADEGVYNNAGTTLATNGQTVQQWSTLNNVAAANATQATAANRPTFQTNVANGNPVVRFNTTHWLDFGTLSVTNTSDLAMFMTFQPTVSTGGGIGDDVGRYMLDRFANTTPRISLKLMSTGKIGFQERADAGSPGGPSTTSNFSTTQQQIVDFYRDYSVRFGIYYNGAQEATFNDTGGTLRLYNLRLGNLYSGNNGLTGDISEYIFYNRKIIAAERNRIDSYLAIKYGLTLSQVTLTNYTASDGVVVYPATSTHASYTSDIAGIAKDNVSRLNQTNSQSVNANSVVRVSSPSSLDDLDFFIWGDNAGSLTSPTSSGVDGTVIKRRLSRVWKVAERGEVGTTTFAFDLTNVPGSKSQADLRMMVDGNNNGFADNDTGPFTGTLSGQIFTVTGVNLKHGDFFTIGTTNITSTPLPIQLVNFDVKVKENGVLASWLTSNEINNDYFTLERSLDGEDFEDVLRIPGAGTTRDDRYYEVLDNPRSVGDIYYRLKQTDFDGKSSVSATRRVRLETSPFFVKMYPNPVDQGEFNIELPANDYVARIELINSAGQVVYSTTSNSSNSVLNVSGLPKGIYFVRVIANSGAASSKVVIR